GADQVAEAPNADSDTLDFSGLSAPVTLDLGSTAPQVFGTDLTLALSDGSGLENAVGTAYADRITGNARDNALYGGGGADRLDGGPGDDRLQGDVTQVVYLDFASHTDPTAGEHDYTAEERAAIQARLETVFAPFNYAFAQDLNQARALTATAGGG